MKLVTFKQGERERLGLMISGDVYDLNACDPSIPENIISFLSGGQDHLEKALAVSYLILNNQYAIEPVVGFELLAPLPKPPSCRDGYAFRQHVAAARLNRGLPMIPQFDEYPIFYFTNHQAIYGPGMIKCMPDHFSKLDFELEVAVVIGAAGKNIKAAEADKYIAGYMIMNDLSARTLQMEEMLLNLGPAKGKDFATVIGPWLVTPDELDGFKVAPKYGHTGSAYQLQMTCKINGLEVSRGNMSDMDWTFAEIIERASYGCKLFPGDVIGSGTVGTGCFLELNGTGLRLNPDYQSQWLLPGDKIEMEITGLGILKNTIVPEATDWSILKEKKVNAQLPG